MATKRVQGSFWTNKNTPFKRWSAIGSYNLKRGDRYFKLTDVHSGKTRVYESHEAAKKDGWVKQ